jgi:hypothetical protein
MELIAKFDPFLKEHLNNYGNVGSGKTNYISSYTVREIIILMRDKVLKHIIEQIKMQLFWNDCRLLHLISLTLITFGNFYVNI